MSNYKNGKIYKIISKNTDMIYIGSTTKVKLTTRLSEHRHSFNHNGSMSSRNMFLWDDAEIKLIENYPCESKIELRKREQYWLDNLDNLINKNKAKGCWESKECQKEYHKRWWKNTKTYEKSWGGDIRLNNNCLLKIDVNLFS